MSDLHLFTIRGTDRVEFSRCLRPDLLPEVSHVSECLARKEVTETVKASVPDIVFGCPRMSLASQVGRVSASWLRQVASKDKSLLPARNGQANNESHFYELAR